MQQALTRYGIPAMLIVGAVAVLVALFGATGQPSYHANGLTRHAKGPLENLIVSDAGAIPSTLFEDAEGDRSAHLQTLIQDNRALVLNIWFESCAPCEEEMPSLAALQKLTAQDGVAVVAVAVGRDDQRKVNRDALAQWSGGVLDFYYDTSFAIAYDTQSRGFPTTILYNRSGEVARLAGAADWASDEALALIRDIAAS